MRTVEDGDFIIPVFENVEDDEAPVEEEPMDEEQLEEEDVDEVEVGGNESEAEFEYSTHDPNVKNVDWCTMNPIATKVAVIGAGISGAVCASNLAKNGISVTIFESARGPGGRMSRRREIADDDRELYFDHGAPYFTSTNTDVEEMIRRWEARGLVAEWKQNFGSFDFITKKFVNFEKEGLKRKYVGIPGMNSICRALCHEPGIESKFGVMVGRLEWLENEESWTLADVNGQDLGKFNGVVASDKSTFSQRFTKVTGKPPPLDLKMIPGLADMIEEVPVRPCFALMLAFENPLSSIPLKGFSIDNSQLLSWATCDSSKPGRSTSSERWVLRSTEEYAQGIIGRAGLQKPSNAALSEIADELFQEFQKTGLDISLPFFKKAHRWGSAFPAISTTKDEKCIWDKRKKLAICGDFCVSPDVEGAIASGLAAASMFSQSSSCL
ncbi:hypothetical protein LXL04_016097 [Taraxacum kok-saghyz]